MVTNCYLMCIQVLKVEVINFKSEKNILVDMLIELLNMLFVLCFVWSEYLIFLFWCTLSYICSILHFMYILYLIKVWLVSYSYLVSVQLNKIFCAIVSRQTTSKSHQRRPLRWSGETTRSRRIWTYTIYKAIHYSLQHNTF